MQRSGAVSHCFPSVPEGHLRSSVVKNVVILATLTATIFYNTRLRSIVFTTRRGRWFEMPVRLNSEHGTVQEQHRAEYTIDDYSSGGNFEIDAMKQ